MKKSQQAKHGMKVVPSHAVKFWTTRTPYSTVYPKSVAYVTGEHPQDQHFIHKPPADIRIVPVTRKQVASWRAAALTNVNA